MGTSTSSPRKTAQPSASGDTSSNSSSSPPPPPPPFNIQRIAVIGAGPSGLAAAKHLQALGAFAQIDVFEQQAEVGGVWNYSAAPPPPPPSMPLQTDAHGPPEPPLPAAAGGGPPVFPSPMYEDLHTNIPHTLMRYSDLAFPSSSSSSPSPSGEEGDGDGKEKKEEEKEKEKEEGCAIFPRREAVQEYLVAYAREVRHLIRFSTQVLEVAPARPAIHPPDYYRHRGRRDERWGVRTQDLLTGAVTARPYDAVVVASGHYAAPHVPAIEGLTAFRARHPGAVAHSKAYRAPEPRYRGRKVLVVGNSASGLDIANQIRAVARRPVLLSARTPTAPEALAHIGGGGRWEVEEVPEIKRFLAEERGVEFHSRSRDGNSKDEDGKGEEKGRIETDIDLILFCTGYLYTYPFLRFLDNDSDSDNDNDNTNTSDPNNNLENGSNTSPPPPPLITDGRRVHGLAKHLLHTRYPTLAFAGLPSKVIPFPLAEAQMAVVGRLWANRLRPRPSRADLERWAREDEAAWLAQDPRERKGFHVFGRGGDGRYINAMHDWAARATGGGKVPPRWGENELWQRSIYAEAKMRFEETGKQARTLEELGFHFEPASVARPSGDDEGGLGKVSAASDDLDVAG